MGKVNKVNIVSFRSTDRSTAVGKNDGKNIPKETTRIRTFTG